MNYTLSVISTASTPETSGAVSPGRRIANFIVTLSDGSNTTATTVAGFGLNGSEPNRIYVGGSHSMGDTRTIGIVNHPSLSIHGVSAPAPTIGCLPPSIRPGYLSEQHLLRRQRFCGGLFCTGTGALW